MKRPNATDFLIGDEHKEIRERITEDALKVMRDVMPKKIVELNQRIIDLEKGGQSLLRPTPEEIESELTPKPVKRFKRNEDDVAFVYPNAVPSNPTVAAAAKALKKETYELVDQINCVKMWIQLNVPKIEDGNNFGVAIQEEIIGELSRCEDSAFTIMDCITKYYATRAKLVSKVIKYPQVDDFKNAVRELDEKELIHLRICSLDMRNNYAILHDQITKNMEKLTKPRSGNEGHHMMRY